MPHTTNTHASNIWASLDCSVLRKAARTCPDVDVPEPRNAELGQRAEMLLAAAAELATRCPELGESMILKSVQV